MQLLVCKKPIIGKGESLLRNRTMKNALPTLLQEEKRNDVTALELTETEIDLLKLLQKSIPEEEIAERLAVKVDVLHNNIALLLEKLG